MEITVLIGDERMPVKMVLATASYTATMRTDLADRLGLRRSSVSGLYSGLMYGGELVTGTEVPETAVRVEVGGLAVMLPFIVFDVNRHPSFPEMQGFLGQEWMDAAVCQTHYADARIGIRDRRFAEGAITWVPYNKGPPTPSIEEAMRTGYTFFVHGGEMVDVQSTLQQRLDNVRNDVKNYWLRQQERTEDLLDEARNGQDEDDNDHLPQDSEDDNDHLPQDSEDDNDHLPQESDVVPPNSSGNGQAAVLTSEWLPPAARRFLTQQPTSGIPRRNRRRRHRSRAPQQHRQGTNRNAIARQDPTEAEFYLCRRGVPPSLSLKDLACLQDGGDTMSTLVEKGCPPCDIVFGSIDECLLCFEDFTDSGWHRAVRLPCAHLSCLSCMTAWVNDHPDIGCAVCRKTFLTTSS